MAIAHKQTVTTNAGFTTTPDINNIAAPSAGDLLIVGVVTDSDHTVATPPGDFTPIVENLQSTGGDVGMSVYYKIAGASEPSTYTDFLTFGSFESPFGFVSAWTGVDETTPLDVAAASEGSTSGNAKNTPAIEPVTAGAMLVGFFSADIGAATTFTWDGGIDERIDASDPEGTQGYITIGSKTWGGSGAESLGGDFDASVTEPCAELIIALRPAGAASFVPRAIII